MADAHRERAEHRAGHVAQTEPVARCNRRHPDAEAAAATDPAAREQQDSSLRPSMQANGHTATASSLTHREPPNPQATLLMARELLHNRQADTGYDA